MGQEGCRRRVHHCCRHTMEYGVKVEAWPQRSSPCFCAKYRRSVLPKSLRTHPDHTPHIDLVHSSFTHTSNCLTFCASSILLPNTRLSSISHPATVFLFCNLSCTRNLTNPLVLGRKMKKFSRGHSPRTPLLLQTPHKHPHQLRHWNVGQMCHRSWAPA